MVIQVQHADFNRILDALKQFPHGANLEQIEAALAMSIPRRTLQRRLAVLAQRGQLRKAGQARATQYLATENNPVSSMLYPAASMPMAFEARQEPDIYFPMSHEGMEVNVYVRQALQRRQPVGYQRSFLNDYHPNKTFYLSDETRAGLRDVGQVDDVDHAAGTYARQIANRLLVDLSWNSSRLEGNTYSLLETERLLSAGQAATGKEAWQTQMLVNHKDAIEFLIDAAADIDFNRYTVLNLHALLSDNLLEDPMACGRLRKIAVRIGQTVFHPLEGPQRIEECFAQILALATAIEDPFEQAFFAMVHLPYLQPFEDVNKRVSRLAANIPLIRRNLCPLSFVDVPKQTYVSAMLGVYELNRVDLLRDVFIWAYQRSCARYSAVRQSLGEPDPFRARHRLLIAEIIAEVVRSRMTKQKAIVFVLACACQKVSQGEQARLVEVIDNLLLGLHEGNIARYRLRPQEYVAWQANWVMQGEIKS